MTEAANTGDASRITNIVASICFAGLGVFLLVAAQEFEDAGRSTPMFIGAGTIALAVILIATEFLKPRARQPQKSSEGSLWRRLVFVILMGLWVFMLPYLGFLISGFLMFALVAAAVPKHEKWTTKGLGYHAVAGVVTTLVFWFMLTHLLNVPLPEPTLFTFGE